MDLEILLAKEQQLQLAKPLTDISLKPLDEQLLRLLSTCPYVSQLSLGGRLLNVHLTTMGPICRHLLRASRQTLSTPIHSAIFRQPNLRMDVSSLRLEAHPLPDTTSKRDASIFTELMRDGKGKEVTTLAAKIRAAECFIAASLKLSRWCFTRQSDFRNFVHSL